MAEFRNQHTSGHAGNKKWDSEERMPWPKEYFIVDPCRRRSSLPKSEDMSEAYAIRHTSAYVGQHRTLIDKSPD